MDDAPAHQEAARLAADRALHLFVVALQVVEGDVKGRVNFESQDDSGLCTHQGGEICVV